MAFGGLGRGSKHQPLAEINMVPMIDVMLVLLIIFIVTAPLLTHSVKIDLPHAVNTPMNSQLPSVQVAIDKEESLFWNGESVDESALDEKLRSAAGLPEQPEIQLQVDRAARYDRVARFLSAAANKGLSKIAFVTDPVTH